MATKNILALDVGTVRVGVAFAGQGLLVARAITTLEQGENLWKDLDAVMQHYQPTDLIIGLPRGLDGQETDQTRLVREFAATCQQRYNVPLHFQDEALTSVRAKEILAQTKQPVQKKDIDAVAASLILSDYLEENK